MMKMHYKKIGLILASIGIFSAGVVVAATDSKGVDSTKAQVAQDRRDAQAAARTQNVCEKITQLSDNLNQKASEQENRVRTRQQERLTNWENKTSEADYKLEKLRTNWDNNREEQFSKLEDAAKNDAQKKAVKTFEATVKTAIATRQAAMDKAIKAFRAEIKSMLAIRQGQIDSVISSSESSRATALATAKSDCEAGKDAATVRATFQNGLKSTRTKLQNDRQNVDKINGTVQASIQVRRTAVEKAMGDFKTTMEKARVALKTAFKDDTSTATDTTETTSTN